MSQGPWLFRQRDIARAFRAAKAAGITAQVDIALDGRLSITQLRPQEAAEALAPPPVPADAPADALPRDPRLRSWD